MCVADKKEFFASGFVVKRSVFEFEFERRCPDAENVRLKIDADVSKFCCELVLSICVKNTGTKHYYRDHHREQYAEQDDAHSDKHISSPEKTAPAGRLVARQFTFFVVAAGHY